MRKTRTNGRANGKKNGKKNGTPEFKGTIELDVRDSKADWTPYQPKKAPEGAPNVLIVLYDDTGLAAWSPFGGRMDDGHEAYRQWVLKRMEEKGFVPKGTALTPINPLPEDVAQTAPGNAMRPWDSLNADEKKLLARMAEVDAGFSEYTDAQVGRIIDYLEKSGQLENTLIFYCADNGASREGSPNGSVSENKFFNGYPDELAENLKHLDTLGSPDTYNHYPTGWAVAFSTAFQMFKRYSKKLFARMAEVYAGFSEYRDAQVGRIIDYLEKDELAENLKHLDTLGSPDTYNHYPTGWAVAFSTAFQMFKRYSKKLFARMAEVDAGFSEYRDAQVARIIDYLEKDELAENLKHLDTLGSPDTYNHYPTGWAVAFSTAFQMFKRYSKKLFARMAEVDAGFSEYRDAQVGRIIDYLEKSDQLESPLVFYSADNGASGEGSPNGSVNENKFFNGYPDELAENLKHLDTLGSPDTYNHYPTGGAVAFSTPFQMFKRYSQFAGGTYYPNTAPVPEAVAVNLRGRSYKIIADVDLTAQASGVIFAHGSRFGGHSMFIKDRKLCYVYNLPGIEPEKALCSQELPTGKHTIGMEFVREKGGEHSESLGTARLYVDDEVVAEAPLRTQAGCFTLSGDGLCIGYDSGDNVSQEYQNPGTFTGGTILGVGCDVSEQVYLDLEREAVAALARD